MKQIPKRLCELFSEFSKRFPCGGFLHVVISDGNWETKFIVWLLMQWLEFCDEDEKKWLIEHEKDVREMCTLMLELTERQRYKIWGEVKKYEEEVGRND